MVLGISISVLILGGVVELKVLVDLDVGCKLCLCGCGLFGMLDGD